MKDTANRVTGTIERCQCKPRIERRRLLVDATDCPDSGRLTSVACREKTIAALGTCPVVSIRTRTEHGEYVHEEATVGVLMAAARFASLVAPESEILTARARRDPIGAAHDAVIHSAHVGRLATETGLIEGMWRVVGGEDAFENVERELNSLTSSRRTRAMLHNIDGAGELSAEDLRARYDERVRAVIDERGSESVADETSVSHEQIVALSKGESPELTLEDAAAILATSPEEPDAEAIVIETRDHLLMGMTTAVLDVEAVESGIDGAFDAREIQQKIEGRLPMTLDELAMIHGYIEQRKP